MINRHYCLVLITLLFSNFAFGQDGCNNRLQVVNLPIENQQGTIKIIIETSNDFKIELFKGYGSKMNMIKTINGVGNQSYLIEKLDRNEYYRVVVDFGQSDNFLCKKLSYDLIGLEN